VREDRQIHLLESIVAWSCVRVSRLGQSRWSCLPKGVEQLCLSLFLRNDTKGTLYVSLPQTWIDLYTYHVYDWGMINNTWTSDSVMEEAKMFGLSTSIFVPRLSVTLVHLYD